MLSVRVVVCVATAVIITVDFARSLPLANSEKCKTYQQRFKEKNITSLCFGDDDFPAMLPKNVNGKKKNFAVSASCDYVIDEFATNGYTITDCEAGDGQPIFRLDFSSPQDALTAFSECSAVDGSHPASITNYAEFKAACNLVRWTPSPYTEDGKAHTWIGLSNVNGAWRWQDTQQLLGKYQRWYPKYPSGSGSCVVLDVEVPNNRALFSYWSTDCSGQFYSTLCKYTGH